MSKHLNDLSAVYLDNIAEEKKCNATAEGTDCPEHGDKACPTVEEGCGCEHEMKDKKKKKKVEEGKQPIHIGRMLSQASNKDYAASKEKNPSKREKLETQARTIRTTVDMDSFKKRKSKIKPQRAGVQEGFSNWRQDLIEVSDGNFDIPSSQAKTDNEMKQEIKDKKVKNKVVINPPLGEEIEAMGGTILEFYEVEEEFRTFPKDKVNNQIDKAKNRVKAGEGKKYVEGDRTRAKVMTAVKNFATKATDTKKTAAGGPKVAGSWGRIKRQAAKQQAKSDKTFAKADKMGTKAWERGAKSAKKKDPNSTPADVKLKFKNKKQDKKHVKLIDKGIAQSNKAEGTRARLKASQSMSRYAAKAKSDDIKKQVEKNRQDKSTRQSLERSLKRTDMEKSYRSTKKEEFVMERPLDKTEKKEKERIVKGMKKSMPELKKRYGDDAKSVMYATATKRAKEKLDTIKSDYRYGVEEGTSMKDAPNIKDHKTPNKTNVYYDKHMKQYVPTVKETRDPAKEAEGKKVAGLEKSGRAFGIVQKFRKENPGSRQPKKVRGAKETEGQAAARRRGAQAQRAAKYGLTSKEKKETQARAKYDSPRD